MRPINRKDGDKRWQWRVKNRSDKRWQWRVKFPQDHKHEDHTKWEELPDDLWDFIFAGLAKGHLKNVSLVCKRFLSLSNRNLTNLYIPFPSLEVEAQPTVPLQRLFSRFTHIQSIDLRGRDPNLDGTITQIANSNLSLKSFSLCDQTYFPREAMRLLGCNMSKTLRSLSFKDFLAMNNDDLSLIGNYFPYLQKLKLEEIDDDITDAGILEISTKLNSLLSLNLTHLRNLSYKSYEYLASNCSLLRKLRAEFHGYNCNFSINLFYSFSHLTSLKLTLGSKLSTDGILAPLCRANSKLEKLNLSFCGCTSDINGEVFCQFLKSLGNLRFLTLKNFTYPSDIKAVDFTASIPSIREIHLSNKWWPDDPLPPATLYYLLENCKLLEHINISGNLETRHQDWLRIPSHRSMRTLRLKFGGDLTYRTLMRIVSICPRLFALKIKWCSRITYKGFQAVIRRYNNIEYYMYDH